MTLFSLRRALGGIAAAFPLFAFVALAACEDAMIPAEAPPPSPASMPRAPQLAQSAAVSENVAAEVTDAGAVSDEHHALLISICSVDKSGCRLAQPSPPPDDASYRVVLGGGVGAIRTRGQAMAELYKEIRDRTGSGGHLAAEPRHIGDVPAGAEGAKASPRTGAAGDPVVEAAFQLMDAVDRDGELTIDSLPMRAASSCKLSLASPGMDRAVLDGGAARCLVEGASASSALSPSRRGGQ